LTLKVPGYFAADGNAANTGASNGNKWRVKFSPPTAGEWKYKVSFRSGKDIAASLNDEEGKPIEFDGLSGTFTVDNSDTQSSNYFDKGALEYVGERYLQFANSKEWFVKAGAGGPENLFGYSEFDSTYNVPGGISTDSLLGEDRLHNYEPHLKDWKPGDPTWKNGKGKAIIGAVNYLSAKGLNTIYLVINNVNGDGRDCWPWTDYNERDVYDVSKLDQWDIVFQHMNRKGLNIDFLMWESENTKLLNNGDMGIERKIYYRELVARFSYLPVIRWNVSEEPTITPEQMIENVKYISEILPTNHPVGAHSGHTKERHRDEFTPLLGERNFDGAWLQVHEDHHETILKWINKSDSAGHKWVVSVDESLPIYTTDTDKARKIFWEIVTAGGEGLDIYFGYGGGTCDIANEDFRNRDEMWDQLSYGIDLFRSQPLNKSLAKMKNHNELGTGRILADPGNIYLIHSESSSISINLENYASSFKQYWLNPIEGGGLKSTENNIISGPGKVNIKNPFGNWKENVLLLVKKNLSLIHI
jgi:hypothetical protein